MLRQINQSIRKADIPLTLKYISMAAYIVLIIIGLSANSSNGAFLKVLRNTNPANLIVWSYWWPAIIITAIFFGWRVKDQKVYETCKDKSCTSKKHIYNLNYKSCGVDLYPANINDNSDCILCAGCHKTFSKYKSNPNQESANPQLTYIGFANDLFQVKPLKVAEMIFVLVVSGFVIKEIWSEWTVTNKFLSFFPDMIIKPLSLSNNILVGFIKGFVVFGIIPFVIWLIPFIISMLFGTTLKIKDYFLNYGVAFIPIIAAAHLSKAILKTTSRIPYFEHLFKDMTGVSTAQQIIDGGFILKQNPLWLSLLVTFLITIIIFAGIWLSIKVVKQINKKEKTLKSDNIMCLLPYAYGSIFLIMIFIWR